MFKKEFAIINIEYNFVVAFTTNEGYKTNKNEIIIPTKDFYKMMKKNYYGG